MKPHITTVCFPSPDELKDALFQASNASWRTVLASVAQWDHAARSAGQSLNTEALLALGAASLNKRSSRIALGLIDKGFLTDVPQHWLEQACVHGQVDLALALIQRASPTTLERGQKAQSESLVARAGRAGHVAILEALAHRCVQEPWGMAVVLAKASHDDETLARMVPVLMAMGSSSTELPRDARFLFKEYRQTPLEVAFATRKPRTAMALLDAGADPGFVLNDESKWHTTLAHRLFQNLNQWPAAKEGERKALGHLLLQMAAHPAWWKQDFEGKRPVDGYRAPPCKGEGSCIPSLVHAAEARATLGTIRDPKATTIRPRL